MPVNSHHPLHQKYVDRYALVRKIVDNDAKRYLRWIDPNDPIRSQQYVDDAILTNFTALTKNGLVGLIFRKPPSLQLPDDLLYLLDDAFGDATSLVQGMQKTADEVIQTGRYGLLVDYPAVPVGQSLKDSETISAKSFIKAYSPEAIINWGVQQIGTQVVLKFVTLWEQINDPDNTDPFVTKLVDRWRVVSLDDQGEYIQKVYRAGKANLITGEPTFELDSSIKPLRPDGQPWKIIPFQFVGSENNNPDYDPIPLYDLAIINLGHYRNSADLEESVFVCGQMMPVWYVGGSAAQFEALNPNGVIWGSRHGVNVGESGDVKLVQANPNQLVSQVMKDKIEQAVTMGARLIQSTTGRETAEGARIRYGSQNSALYTLTTNISNAYTQCLMWICEFMNADSSKIVCKLNDVFYDDNIDPQLMMALIQGNDRGWVSATEMRAYIKTHGGDEYLTASDKEAETAAHLAAPLSDNIVMDTKNVNSGRPDQTQNSSTKTRSRAVKPKA